MTGTKKTNDYPKYMYDDGDRGGFLVINPLTGKKKRFDLDEEPRARAAATLLKEWVDGERQQRLLDAGKPLIKGLVDKWKSDRLPYMPWSPSTKQSKVFKLNRIRRELGDRVVARTDRIFISEWIDAFCHTADTFNDWRDVFIELWKEACFQKWCDVNEPSLIPERSTSKKIESNHKVRHQIDLAGFRATYKHAPPFCQVAMELSFVTLQGRSECCNMQYSDIRGGFIYVIRDKTSADSEMAFIKIAVTDEIDALVRRSRQIDGGVVSPYVIHRTPFRNRREWTEGKPHWTYVNGEYLSKAFAKARDVSGHFDDLDANERPPFHEVRGLGGRTYVETGALTKDEVSSLMTHSDKKVTEIYLEKGRGALSDADFRAVRAPLRLRDVFGSGNLG